MRGFKLLLDKNLALYWGTSRWNSQQLTEAWSVANRLNMVGPLVDQGSYSLAGTDDDAMRPWPFPYPPRGNGRSRVEVEMPPLMTEFGMGLSTFSPTAGGLLTDDAAAAAAASPISGDDTTAAALKEQGKREVRAVAAQLQVSETQWPRL